MLIADVWRINPSYHTWALKKIINIASLFFLFNSKMFKKVSLHSVFLHLIMFAKSNQVCILVQPDISYQYLKQTCG